MRLNFIASIICLATVQSLYAQDPVLPKSPFSLCGQTIALSDTIRIVFNQELPFPYSFEVELDDTFFIRGKCVNKEKWEPLFITRKSKAGSEVLSDGSSPYPASFYCGPGKGMVVPSVLYPKKSGEGSHISFDPQKIKLTVFRPGQEDLKAERVLVPGDRHKCHKHKILWRVN